MNPENYIYVYFVLVCIQQTVVLLFRISLLINNCLLFLFTGVRNSEVSSASLVFDIAGAVNVNTQY